MKCSRTASQTSVETQDPACHRHRDCCHYRCRFVNHHHSTAVLPHCYIATNTAHNSISTTSTALFQGQPVPTMKLDKENKTIQSNIHTQPFNGPSCGRLPGWASTRRNIHQLTTTLVIKHPLSTSYDP